MVEPTHCRCGIALTPAAISTCRRVRCKANIHLKGSERIKRQFLAELDDWLKPDLLYHCFTGECDDHRLRHVASLDHVLQGSLLNKAQREWPARLAALDLESRKEKRKSKKAVKQFILDYDA